MSNKKGMLIVMEGACDGIGKSTQFEKLKEKLISLGYDVVSHHFPSYGTFQGKPVEKYLAGEFGSIDELSPYFINSLYATDRAITWLLELKKEYDRGKIILLDRYTTSSIIYQAAVISDSKEKDKFIDYIIDYEYNKIGIPSPDMVIFLTAEFDLVTKLRRSRTNYEGNSNDIHEANLDFMHNVYDNAIHVANYLKWDKIKCDSNDEFKSIEEIHTMILERVLKKLP